MSVTTRSGPRELDPQGPAVVDMNSTKAVAATVSPHTDVRSPSDEKPGRWSNGLDWPSVLWIGLIHLGALASVLCFTWKGLLVAVVLGLMTGCLGVCLGYHRLLTHRSFQTFPLIRQFLAVLGTLAGEGPPITWIAIHRKHHQYSDTEGDPHSPRQGAWWSHMLWIFPRPRSTEWRRMMERYAKDLLEDPFMRLLDKTFLAWHVALGLGLFIAGWLVWDWYTGVSLLVYGMFLRQCYVLHVTWLVNSASHMWGYRNYDTRDDSRNLWWVGLLAYGEGWHNNHHASPTRARHGRRWWEFDATYIVIRAMEISGLAWKVVRGPRSNQAGS
ncbi:MAG: fatty acid desaturase [Planctomycetes bacterium]|nr:fatty acid desaturase [Planctomycetota bacterium]